MSYVRATVGAIIEQDGKLLLEKRAVEPFKGRWSLPGGHIEYGETAIQAVIREVKEETNLDVMPKFFRIYDEILPELNWHAAVSMFTAKANGKLKPNDEVSALEWVTKEKALSMKLAFMQNRILGDYYGNKD